MKSNTRHMAKREQGVKILSPLLALLDCSLARYLSNARPWVRRPYMLLDAIARRISCEQEMSVRQLARLIYDRRGTVQPSAFPMEFTSYNDLSLEFLAPLLLEQQRTLARAAEEIAEQLADDPEARRVVNDIVASLRRYAELLQELGAPHRVTPPTGEEDPIGKVRRRPVPATNQQRFEPYAADQQTAV